jgi:hypothetical protein
MAQTDDTVLTASEKLALARAVWREFHAQCFWYMRADREVALSDLDEIVRGLRLNGGRRGMTLAARLCR